MDRLGAKLTTVMNFPERGPYGDSSYRGNCSGYVQKALFEHYEPKKVIDPFCGSNTTGDVCLELRIDHLCLDLNPRYGGFDILSDEIPESCDFVFSHDAYHDIINYSGAVWAGDPHPNDLSRCETYGEFIQKINIAHAKMYNALRKGGHLAILTGDIKRKGQFYSIIKDMDFYGKIQQHIIKLQHNCFSDNIKYNNPKLIPIVHEHLLIFRKDDHYIIRGKITKTIDIDSRTRTKLSWFTVVLNAMEKLGGKASLKQLYNEIEGHAKTQTNKHWREKIRQVVQTYKDFQNIDRGIYRLVQLGKNSATVVA
ncbi:hypothetical protein NE686_17590 [Tissierella carlieri]|uniref:DNA modification methylase n=1 Tax=Tissierella carlieri TaxID=689904 RepID=A0ABT1SEL3_9FIRM|nr:hypothetical protein [Tissierella carlieri]MCQ4924919.1 hypothetical protein [Tissierella carlieri]